VALTYSIGRAVGESGLPRLVAPERLDRIKARLHKAGAGTLAAAAVLPPPFPLTPFVLTCGALDLDRSRFFLVFGVMRLVRFGTVAFLARYYGERVLQVLESDALRSSVMAFAIVMCAAAIAAAVGLWRRAHLVAISA
jgi:membrane protein DedA with SNARE-associated domain